jgi:hypothetical protein
MGNLVTVEDFGFDKDDIERRKQLVRDLWAGRPLDHVPVYITVENPAPKYSIREQLLDADKQLEEALTVAGLTWKHVSDGDMVPAMRPDVGCCCLATAFGAELFWGDDPNQWRFRRPMRDNSRKALGGSAASPKQAKGS